MRPLAKSKSRFFLLNLLCVRPRSPHSGVLHWVSITTLRSWAWRFLKKHQRVTLLAALLLLEAEQLRADRRCCATKSLRFPGGRTKPTAPQSHRRSLFMLPAEAAKRRGGSSSAQPGVAASGGAEEVKNLQRLLAPPHGAWNPMFWVWRGSVL